MTRKNFVLDTNVLLYDPEALEKFKGNDVFLPLVVLEDLNRQKKLTTELGKNARIALRLIDDFKKTCPGDIHNGLKAPNDVTIFIKTETGSGKPPLSPSSSSNRAIIAAHFLKQDENKTPIFVSKNFVARIKAELLGIEAEDYESLKFSYDDMPRGMREIEVDKSVIDTFYKDGKVDIDVSPNFPNEYFLLKSPENSSAIGKFNSQNNKLTSMLKVDGGVWGIKPLNSKQKCALDLLLRDDIKLVTLVGQAGTGKTLLALACGLRKVFDENVYSKILISRPIIPMGQDIGYLPGGKEEKLANWMQPVYDNLEYICSSSSGNGNAQDTMQWVVDSEKMEMEAMTYIRGRSLPKVYMIIDEAQNLTPHEVKTIISRAGHNTKVILAGDPTQIDDPYLDRDSNGLTFTISRFMNEKIFGHVFLDKTERSELASLAANMM
jgi:PhoH-like ATPase